MNITNDSKKVCELIDSPKFNCHKFDHAEQSWPIQASETVPFEQNTAVLCLQFTLDAGIRREIIGK